jgi:hypothetical protein
LLEQGLARRNKTARGQEVPFFIRLGWLSSSPGIAVVHSVEPLPQSRHFGPYLGGERVRLAASALERVMLLAKAGEALRSSAHDMARVRGAGNTAHHLGQIASRLGPVGADAATATSPKCSSSSWHAVRLA